MVPQGIRVACRVACGGRDRVVARRARRVRRSVAQRSPTSVAIVRVLPARARGHRDREPAGRQSARRPSDGRRRPGHGRDEFPLLPAVFTCDKLAFPERDFRPRVFLRKPRLRMGPFVVNGVPSRSSTRSTATADRAASRARAPTWRPPTPTCSARPAASTPTRSTTSRVDFSIQEHYRDLEGCEWHRLRVDAAAPRERDRVPTRRA